MRDRLLELAASDARVVAAALVGSLAHGGGDRWSDLDLTFGVADDAQVDGVLEDWTGTVVDEFDGVRLFDLEARGTIYRVFLLPGCLQLDVSFTPAAQFRQGSPNFKLVFGTHKVDYPPPPPPEDLFGWAVAYARTARASIDRGRLWQAEYSISAVRDNALSLACLERGLASRFGKGYDELPPDVLEPFAVAIVQSLEPTELRRALREAVDGLLRHAPATAAQVESDLRELAR